MEAHNVTFGPTTLPGTAVNFNIAAGEDFQQYRLRMQAEYRAARARIVDLECELAQIKTGKGPYVVD